MSLLHQTDVFQPEEKTARKHYGHGFALALICVALAVVLAGEMFINAFRPNGTSSALAASTLDPLAMMTTAKDLPTSHYDDYSVVFN